MKSDLKLQQDVMAELNWEPSVNAAEIGVEVKDGIVTLSGHIDSYAEKWHAEKATERVTGVKAITVDIEVKLPSDNIRTDVDIARSAENVLQWLVLPKNAIKVRVEKGWVTLSGAVDWQFQRHIAYGAVRYLMGVRGVSNQIAINRKLSSKTVQSDIESALMRTAKSDAEKITVEINGNDIILRGNVHSVSERELAKHAAWATQGVHHVVDHLKVI